MTPRALMAVSATVATALLGAGAGHLAAERDAGSVSFHREITWQGQDGQRVARGLYLIRHRPDLFTVRILAGLPDGSRLIVTQSLDPRSGSEETTLSDDATGWWVRLTKDFGVSAETLGEFFRTTERELPFGGGKELTFRLTTSDGFLFEAPIAVLEPKDMHRAFLERLRTEGSETALTDSVPVALHGGILFLDSSLSPEPLPWLGPDDNIAHSVRGPLEILGGALRRAPLEGPTSPGGPWPMAVGSMKKGLSPTVPSALELIAGFRSVAAERLLPEPP